MHGILNQWNLHCNNCAKIPLNTGLRSTQPYEAEFNYNIGTVHIPVLENSMVGEIGLDVCGQKCRSKLDQISLTTGSWVRVPTLLYRVLGSISEEHMPYALRPAKVVNSHICDDTLRKSASCTARRSCTCDTFFVT